MTKYVGVLTAGGDTPGLNAALRAMGKSSHSDGFDMQLTGFYNGFRGLLHDRNIPLEKVVERRKTVPLDHHWYETARRVGTCLGD